MHNDMPQVLRIFVQVMEALAEQHRQQQWFGVCLPDRVVVEPTGVVSLQERAWTVEQSAGYLAPECVNGEPWNAHADLYSLGVWMYQVLTERLPVRLEHGLPESPSYFNPHVPPQLDRIVLKLLNEKPEKRYPNVEELIREFFRLFVNVPQFKRLCRAETERETAAALSQSAGRVDLLRNTLERRQEIFSRLRTARQLSKSGKWEEVTAELERAIQGYAEVGGTSCPASVRRTLAEVLFKRGETEQVVAIYLALYAETGRVLFYAYAVNVYARRRSLDRLTPHLETVRNLLATGNLSLAERLSLLLTMAVHDRDVGRTGADILAMEAFYRENAPKIREQLGTRRIVATLFNLNHLLKYVPDVPKERHRRYLYEAAGLAESRGMSSQLRSIYTSIAVDVAATNLKEARTYMLKAADHGHRAGEWTALTTIYHNLAAIYWLMGDPYHAYSYVEQAMKYSKDGDMVLQKLAELALFVDDFEKAEQAIRDLYRLVKANGDKRSRKEVFLLRFESYLRQGLIKRADRMYPFVEGMRDALPLVDITRLRGMYLLLKGQAELLIEEFEKWLEETTNGPERRLGWLIILTEALLQAGRYDEGLKRAQELNRMIAMTGHFIHSAEVNFLLGRLYRLMGRFVDGGVHLKRAAAWYRKFNHQKRLRDVDLCLNQEDRRMVTQIKPSLSREAQHWLSSTLLQKDEAIDALSEKEVLFEATRRVGASIAIGDVCENLAAVVFDQMFVDRIHLGVRINQDRVMNVHLSEQLLPIDDPGEAIQGLLGEGMKGKEAREQVGSDAYYYTVPILSHDDQVIGAMVLERGSIQGTLSHAQKRFLHRLSQLVASHVKNAIMYETIITDYLTGLYTRDYFIKRLEEEFAKIRELGGDLSFVMLDLDNFSKINNTYGHNEGDRALRQVAQVLKGAVRSQDIVGRFGGEEMIVILPNTNALIAKTMAEGMLDALRTMTVEGDRYRLTASVGVGNYLLDQPVDITDLIEKADRAETLAKREGKNRVYCHWELQEAGSGE